MATSKKAGIFDAAYSDALEAPLNSGSNCKPRRPGLPPLLCCASCLWASCAATYSILYNSEQSARIAICVTAAALVACLAVALVAGRRKRLAFLSAAFCLAGVSLAAAASYAYFNTAESMACASSQDCEIRLLSDPRKTERGFIADGEVFLRGGMSAKATVFMDDATDLYYSAIVAGNVSFKALSDDYATSGYLSGSTVQASIKDHVQLPLTSGISAIYEIRKKACELIALNAGDAAGILQALVCGYRPTIKETGEYEEYKTCGLAHIVAVSGAHLAIATMAFAWLLKMLKTPRKANATINVAFVIAYLLFSGMPISAIRAAVMVVLSLVSGIASRRNATLNSLSVCVICFICIDPVSSTSISLFLSAASTFGIVMFSRLFASWASWTPPFVKKSIVEPLSLTASSNIMTLPFSVSTFGMLPLLSPIANVVATPLFTIACVFGLLSTILSCAFEQIAPYALGAAAHLARPLMGVVSYLASLPGATMEVSLPVLPMITASILASAILYVAWPTPSKRMVLTLTALSMLLLLVLRLPSSPISGDVIAVLDVGQGDSILVHSEEQTLLVDTGNEDAKLDDALRRLGVQSIDYVAITHPDDDHCASLEHLLSLGAANNVLCARALLDCHCPKCEKLKKMVSSREGATLKGVSVGDSIKVGNFTLEVVWPRNFEDSGGNQDSVCMSVEIDCDKDGKADWRGLLTGDAESDSLEKIAQSGRLDDVDFLKVGHHGSKVSLSKSTLKSLKPEIGLISVGAGNRYGHPSPEALQLLEEGGAEVLRTDTDGTVSLLFTKEKIAIEKEAA